jgi:hypothetical protein
LSPQEHKLAAARYFVNRILAYSIDPIDKQTELNTVKQMLFNNKYNVPATINTLMKEKNQPKSLEIKQNKKWTKFTFVGKETRLITRLLKNTNIKVAFTTSNNLGKLLSHQSPHTHKNKYSKNGVYQLICPTCKRKYIGQTGRPFLVKYKEHYADFKHANNKSKYAQHILEENHTFGPMEEIITPLRLMNKRKMMDTWDRFYIYKETRICNQINDKLTIQSKPIFDAVVRHHAHRGHQPHN